MNCNRRHLLGTIAAGSAGLIAPRSLAAVVTSGNRPLLLLRALAALDHHGPAIRHRDRVGIVDFSVHSCRPRFSIIDIGNAKVLSTHLVAHGRGSDPANRGIVERFSNRPGSHASSRGSFLTSAGYVGKHGRSRRLQGLDRENSKAASRAIVIHGADYVSQRMANSQGRVGRSLGCFSVPRRDIGDVLDQLGPGRLLFAWK